MGRLVNGAGVYEETGARLVNINGQVYEETGVDSALAFVGPDIVTQNTTQGTTFVFDDNGQGPVSARFTGATSYDFAPGSDQPPGITINPTTGIPEGNTTQAGTFSVRIEGFE